jgi:hypothetical protein
MGRYLDLALNTLRVQNNRSEEPPPVEPSASSKPEVAKEANKANKALEAFPDLGPSFLRLQVEGISIAVLEDGTMRVVRDPAETQRAIRDGFTVYSPDDMYHYVQLQPHERRLLHSFKKKYGGTTQWTDLENKK